MTGKKKPIRCAVYTRNSSAEGLEQDFNSLNTRRAAAETYMHSQKHEGWTLLRNRFDGGISGASVNAPTNGPPKPGNP